MANENLTAQAALHKQIADSIASQNASLRDQIPLVAMAARAATGTAEEIKATGQAATAAMGSASTATTAVTSNMTDLVAATEELPGATAAAGAGFVDSMGAAKQSFVAAAVAYDNLLEGFQQAVPKTLRTELSKVQELFGGLSGEGGVLNATNDQAKAFVKTNEEVYNALLANSGPFHDAFGMYPQLALGDLTEVMGEFNQLFTGPAGTINSLEIAKVATGDFVLEQQSLAKSMNLNVQQQNVFMTRQISLTGKAGNDMLREAAVYSKNLSEITGDSMKMISGNIVGIIEDTTNFGNVTVAEAARISVTLRQMGLGYKELAGTVGQFMNFDSAVQSVSALTTVFGVQMDAMEMMQLANEDQETFLRRMREQFLMSAKSVDEMSLAEKRLIMQQTGLSDVGAVERFLDPTAVISSFEQLSAGTGEVGDDMSATLEYLASDIVNLQQAVDVQAGKIFDTMMEKVRAPFAMTAITIEQKLVKAIRKIEPAIPKAALGAFSELGKGMADIAKMDDEAIDKIANSLTGFATSVGEAGKAVVKSDMADGVKGVVDKAGPEGKEIGKTMSDGIISGMDTLVAQFDAVIMKLVTTIKKSDLWHHSPGSKVGDTIADGLTAPMMYVPEKFKGMMGKINKITDDQLKEQLKNDQSYYSKAARELGFMGLKYDKFKTFSEKKKLEYKELFKLGDDYESQMKKILKSQQSKTGSSMSKSADYMTRLLEKYKRQGKKASNFSDSFKETLRESYGITDELLTEALEGSGDISKIAEGGIRERQTGLDKEAASKRTAAKEAEGKKKQNTRANNLRQSTIAANSITMNEYLRKIAEAVGTNGTLINAVKSGPDTGYSPAIDLLLDGKSIVKYVTENAGNSGGRNIIATTTNNSG